MFNALVKTLEQLLSASFRKVLWRSLGFTLLMFLGLWFGIKELLSYYFASSDGVVETLIWLLSGFGMIIGMAFLLAPITSLFAGFFLDQLALEVEKKYYPDDTPGKEPSLGQTVISAIGFTFLTIIVNIFVLLIFLLPGVNMMVFYLGNGYLLGREFFEMIGARHMDIDKVKALRKKHWGSVFLNGILIAFILSIPIINLLTPLFATAYFTHIFKNYARRG